MDNYTAANQKQNMLLSVRDDPSSIDFDMVDFENSDQPTNSYQDADMEVRKRKDGNLLLTCENSD